MRWSIGEASRATLEAVLDFTHLFFLFNVLSLVVVALALADGDLDLDQASLTVDAEWYNGLPSHVLGTAKFVDFPAMQQQLALARGLVVLDVSESVFVHMHVVEEGTVALDANKTVSDLAIAGAYGLYLGPLEGNPSLILFADLIVTSDPAIANLKPARCVLGLGTHRSSRL